MTLTMASFSGGKDSTAMVLRMIEKRERLDKVVFCDTGMEFPAMYAHIEKVQEFVESQGIEFVRLEPEHSFEYMLMEKPIDSKKHGLYYGYSWPGMQMRWCTKHLKVQVQERYRRELRESTGEEIITCTGLAADEIKRLERKNNLRDRHPLVEWGWTEDVCLGYCYGKGYDWFDPSTGKGLYDIFSRTSCWICPLGTVDNFRQLRRWYPDLWAKIGEMEARIKAQRESEIDRRVANAWRYTPKRSWQELEDRFALEEDRFALENMGIQIKRLDDFFPEEEE